ncbi:acetyl-CoA carboxylase biotin carboxyl carrier protein [Phytoactinopolyspora endophytica]|uniref:acetyl-CoA carboxylase biotin carboxyl carrier protein n=1 Tax=Phytoactinopolyspora endophytica TaxID=1642495 RepID=UPI00101BA41B|nr:acetyl-CoA carboxylase biotin carboxyl carrier protein [Phytoactinopolyspora endophytica]
MTAAHNENGAVDGAGVTTAADGAHSADVAAQAELVTHLRTEASKLIAELDGRVRSVQVDVGGCAVRVEWADPQPAVVVADAAGNAPVGQHTAQAGGSTVARAAADGQVEPSTQPHVVCAPLVGTFYRRPSPEAEPFVEVGHVVEAGQTLAIVEAMKLMNEIKADRPGRVGAIHPGEGEMVEFGQVLLELEADTP